jgi:hypothetical protein
MTRHLRLLPLVLGLAAVGLAEAEPAGRPVTPLTRAHAHNDYEHPRPLLDALDHGFCSVEADIHWVDGELLVAHDLHQTRPGRTLEALYLEPLRQRAQQHGGSIYAEPAPFTLLIDFKSDAQRTYATLKPLLEAYRDILTEFRPDSTRTNAVTVILSGNRPRDAVAAEPVRYAAIDGRLGDLGTAVSVHLIPLISDNWRSHFRWRGVGPLPNDEREKLAQIVRQTHQQGRRIRFWAIPDIPEAWREMHRAGVDLINTDNLTELRTFLTELPAKD